MVSCAGARGVPEFGGADDGIRSAAPDSVHIGESDTQDNVTITVDAMVVDRLTTALSLSHSGLAENIGIAPAARPYILDATGAKLEAMSGGHDTENVQNLTMVFPGLTGAAGELTLVIPGLELLELRGEEFSSAGRHAGEWRISFEWDGNFSSPESALEATPKELAFGAGYIHVDAVSRTSLGVTVMGRIEGYGEAELQQFVIVPTMIANGTGATVGQVGGFHRENGEFMLRFPTVEGERLQVEVPLVPKPSAESDAVTQYAGTVATFVLEVP